MAAPSNTLVSVERCLCIVHPGYSAYKTPANEVNTFLELMTEGIRDVTRYNTHCVCVFASEHSQKPKHLGSGLSPIITNWIDEARSILLNKVVIVEDEGQIAGDDCGEAEPYWYKAVDRLHAQGFLLDARTQYEVAGQYLGLCVFDTAKGIARMMNSEKEVVIQYHLTDRQISNYKIQAAQKNVSPESGCVSLGDGVAINFSTDFRWNKTDSSSNPT